MNKFSTEEKQYIVDILSKERDFMYEAINDARTNEKDRKWLRSRECILHKALKHARALGFNINGMYSYEYINQQLATNDED